jgi:predicted nucleic acid-binding protein
MLPQKLGLQITMVSLDTNVILRYFLNDIAEQSLKSRSLIVSSTPYVTDVVLTEVIFVLEKVIEMDRRDIVRLVKTFLSLPNLTYNYYFLDQTIDLYGAHDGLSFVDCYAATEAKTYNNTLATFDQQLAKYGGDHVKEPSQVRD